MAVPRLRIFQAVGLTALLPTLVTAAFFIIYTVSSSIQHSILSVVSVVSAALSLCTCIPILVFTVYHPSCRRRLYRQLGAIASGLAAMASACALGWMGLRQQDLPRNIFGRNPVHVVLAGSAVYIVAVIMHSVFWTMLLAFSVSSPSPNTDREANTPPPPRCLCAARENLNLPLPSPTFSAGKQSIDSSIRASKHRSFVAQLYQSPGPTAQKPSPSLSMGVSPFSPMYTIKGKDVQTSSLVTVSSHRSPSEINHFDDWETSDVYATERVAASLAVVERETMQEATIPPIAIPVPRKLPLEPGPVSSVYESEISVLERVNSPPLPENDVHVVSSRTAAIPPWPLGASGMGMASPTTPRFVIRGGGGEGEQAGGRH